MKLGTSKAKSKVKGLTLLQDQPASTMTGWEQRPPKLGPSLPCPDPLDSQFEPKRQRYPKKREFPQISAVSFHHFQ